MELVGKVAVVTGAAWGIGRAVALALAAEGASAVIADVDEAGGREAAALADEAGGRAAFVRADAARERDVRAMLAVAEERFGGLDVLVLNAGGVEAPFFPEAPVERWRRVVELNLAGVMLGIQCALEPLRRRGGGAIVGVSSVAGLGTAPHGAPEYAAAKAAVIRLTASLASLHESHGVRVNCVCPDWVDTPAVRRSLAGMTAEERSSVPPLVPAAAVAGDVLRLVRDDGLAGRILVRRAGEDARLLPAGLRE